jgi:hypothetical protein
MLETACLRVYLCTRAFSGKMSACADGGPAREYGKMPLPYSSFIKNIADCNRVREEQRYVKSTGIGMYHREK